MQENDYKLIDLYLRGELKGKEAEAVEEKAKSDEAFAEELRFQQEVKGFFQHREKRDAFKANLVKLQSEKKAKVVPLRRRILFIAGVAAALALVIFFAWPFLMPGSLYQQFDQHEPLAFAERSDNDELMQSAETAFNNGNFNLAYTKLKELQQINPEDARIRLATGIAALETERLTEAKATFSSLRAGQSAVRDQASWYMALTYVKEEDFERARNVLNTIPEESFWGERAQNLLKKLP